MLHAVHDAPFGIPPECDTSAVECLDASGRPLLVTPRPQRTGLVHVCVGVLFCAPGRRVHARQVSGADSALEQNPVKTPGWTLAACGPVRAGEAGEDAVWRQVLADSYWKNLLAPLILPDLLPMLVLEPAHAEPYFPAQQFGLVRFCLYRARIPVTPPPDDSHLWLDPHEVSGLAAQFPGLFSPLLTVALSLFHKPKA